MHIIQNFADLELLKAKGEVPTPLIKSIEQDFLILIEEEMDTEPLTAQLPFHKAIVLLEAGDEVLDKVGNAFDIEYIERITEGCIDFYRIAKRHDHEIQLIYTLIGVHDSVTEQWLEKQAE